MNMSDKKWIVSKMCVIDSCPPSNRTDRSHILVTIYGFAGEEMSIASLTKVDHSEIKRIANVNRFVYLTGQGETFVLPGTRLQLNIDDFFNRILNGYALQKFTYVRFRLAKIKELDGAEKLVYQTSKLATEPVNEAFSYLTVDEMRDRRKSDRQLEKDRTKSLNNNISNVDSRVKPKVSQGAIPKIKQNKKNDKQTKNDGTMIKVLSDGSTEILGAHTSSIIYKEIINFASEASLDVSTKSNWSERLNEEAEDVGVSVQEEAKDMSDESSDDEFEGLFTFVSRDNKKKLLRKYVIPTDLVIGGEILIHPLM